MAKLLEYNATLTARTDFEDTLSSFRVKCDEIISKRDADGTWFVPGQYVTIGMNREVVEGQDDPRPTSVRRPMSIVSAPEEGDELEFYIRYVNHPESTLPLTQLLWPIQVGDRLYIRSHATGKFTLPDTVGDDDRRLKILLAAGTGLAPFISIARSRILRDPKARLDDLAILHGASYPTGLGYRSELDRLVAEHGLKYVPTISRPQKAPDWSGFTGRAEALVGPDNIDALEDALGLGRGEFTPANAAVLICGLNGTIANCVIDLAGRGFVPDNRKLRRALEVPDDVAPSLFWEQYDTAPPVDTKDEALMGKLRAQLHAALAG
jgi:ferredoxin--NADP+ reductase